MFCAFFKKDWTLIKQEHCPTFTPFFRIAVNPNNTELYEKSCRNRLLQFKPGTTPDNVLGGFETHEDCLKDFVENHPRCPGLIKEEFENAQVKKVKKKGTEKEEDNYDDFLDVSDDDLCPDVDGVIFKHLDEFPFLIILFLLQKIQQMTQDCPRTILHSMEWGDTWIMKIKMLLRTWMMPAQTMMPKNFKRKQRKMTGRNLIVDWDLMRIP